MSRPPYPHRCLGGYPFVWACRCEATPKVYSAETARDGWGSDCPIALRERIAEQDRHITSLDCRFAGHVAELSGKHCPPGQPCERCEAESRAERAEAERDAAMDEARRLRDLVRHQRGPLHDAELITDAEYAALAADAGAVARLRGYDEMRRELAEAGSRYRDHLPAVITATEPVQLDRPMVMAEVVGERSCFTCKYDHHRPGLAAHWCSADGGTDPRFGLYMVKSGVLGTDDLMPTNRTVRCPGWSPKDPL